MSNLEKPIPDGLTAFDQLYIDQLESFYKEIETLADTIWPGMKLCPVCIYRQDGPAFLYKHPNPPESLTSIGEELWLGKQADLQLYAATQFDINGALTAINFYDRMGKDCPIECFYAELFHEMHHVYQLNHMSSPRWDDPGLIITYPELVENDAIKNYENRILVELALPENQQRFQELLNEFYSCRLKRQKIIGDTYLDMEKRVESMEGPATYCQYKYLESRDRTAWDRALFKVARHEEFFWLLCQPEHGRYHLRHRLLMTGLAQCLILSRQEIPDWQQEYFNSNMLLNDYLFSKLPVRQVPVPDSEELNAKALFFLDQTHKDRKQRFEKFEKQVGFRLNITFNAIPQCRGFDPMNAEAIDAQTVMHNTTLKLGNVDNSLFFNTGGILTYIVGSVFEITSLTVFIQDRNQIKNDNGSIMLDSEGKQLNWRGRIVSESKNEISIELE